MRRADHDPVIETLARLYRDHPAWVAAAGRLSARATSAVYFRHRPGEVWHLVQRGGAAELRPGPAADPDLVFRFSPGAVEALAQVDGGVGAFALRLFELIAEESDPERRVELRIRAGFPRLVRRGYLALLLSAGPAVLAFGARHGIRTPAALARLVEALRRRDPEEWESAAVGDATPGSR